MSELAICVQPVNTWETWRLEARVCRIEGSELLNTQWGYTAAPGREYDGFHVQAYLGDLLLSSVESKPIWGCGYYYDPHRIENAEQAKEIARVLTRVEKGLAKLNDDEGYLTPDDFAGTVLRVARILKIRELRVRNRPDVARRSGEQWKKVSGSSLQWWVGDVGQLVEQGKRGELIAR